MSRHAMTGWVLAFSLFGGWAGFGQSAFAQPTTGIPSSGKPDSIGRVVAKKSTGTGRTTGHIVMLTVFNPGDADVLLEPQTFYIPSGNQYQSYVATIPSGLTLPGGHVMDVPLMGYCADIHRPPFPSGVSLPPVSDWIAVTGSEVRDVWLGFPGEGIPYPQARPADTTGKATIPAGTIAEVPPPSSIPSILEGPRTVTGYTPDDIPMIVTSPGYRPAKPPLTGSIVWPGTDRLVGGTIDAATDPETFAQVVTDVVGRLETAYEHLVEEGLISTPFEADSARQQESVIQQGLWMYTSELTGQPYGRDDFADKVYTQFQDNTGRDVATLPAADKVSLDEGVTQFWSSFQATGAEAKVIAKDALGPDTDPGLLYSITAPRCRCEAMSYTLEVTRRDTVVHRSAHTTPRHPRVSIPRFKYGDDLEVTISGISVDCPCVGGSAGDTPAPCAFYPAQSTNPDRPGYTEPDTSRTGRIDIEMDNDGAGTIRRGTGNHNCENSEKAWSADGLSYAFKLKTRNEGTVSPEVFQRLRLKAYCQAPGCRKALCVKYIQINFVNGQ